MLTHRASLETLPIETFDEIVDSANNTKEPVLRRHRAHFVLSLVNHRLRYLAIPLIFKDIVIQSENDIPDLVAFLQQNNYGPFVRSLRRGSDCWYSRSVWAEDPVEVNPRNSDVTVDFEAALVKVPNLQHYKRLNYPSTQDDVASLSRYLPSLSSLEITWKDDNLPDVTSLPALKTLRIHHTHDTYQDFIPAQTLLLPNLTTLTIHGMAYLFDPSKFATLPNLLVLSLQNLNVNMSDAYHFVQMHPSLLEVNISFPPYLRDAAKLAPLIKLMEGTGVWKKTPGSSSSILDDPTIVKARAGTEEPWMDVNIRAFAFQRTPLPFGGGTGDILDPRRPRYRTTALALQTTYMAQGEFNIEPSSALTCPLSVPSLCVEHLTFKLTEDLGYDSWDDTLNELADYLAERWPHLRQLVLCVRMEKQDIPRANKQYGPWYGIGSRRDELNQFSLNPPVFFDTGKSLTYGDAKKLCDKDDLDDHFPQPEPTDSDGEYSDDEDLMPIWKNMYEDDTASLVRRLAASCPLLEDFVLDVDFPPRRRDRGRASCEFDQVGPRWHWKIIREPGTDTVEHVLGALSWNGCGHGDPIRREILVGQELAYADFLAQEEALKIADRSKNTGA